TPTAYFSFGAFAPFGRTWGAPFPPKATCTPQPSPSPSPSPSESGLPSFGPPSPTPKPTKSPRKRRYRRRARPSLQLDSHRRLTTLTSEVDDRRAVASLAALARPQVLDQGVVPGFEAHGIAQGPGAQAVDDRHAIEAGQGRIVQVALEEFERLLDTCATQVERRRDRSRPIEAQ